MTRLVLASGNAGKLAELRALLGGTAELVAQAELGVADIEETGLTFVENALLKARHAARTTGLAVIATSIGFGKLLSSLAFGWIWQAYGAGTAIAAFAVGAVLALVVIVPRLRAFERG